MSKTKWVYLVIYVPGNEFSCDPTDVENGWFESDYAITSQELVTRFRVEIEQRLQRRIAYIVSIMLMDKYEYTHS